jgi:two-component system phosphate regulon sensor histidine kinase PhoR
MKNKIMMSVIVTITFSLIVLTCSFIAISNYQYTENTKSNLKHYNALFEELILEDLKDMDKKINSIKRLDNEIRFTYINSDGEVIYDTDYNVADLENHKNREEFIQAEKNGEGSSVRYSKTLKKIWYTLPLN